MTAQFKTLILLLQALGSYGILTCDHLYETEAVVDCGCTVALGGSAWFLDEVCT